MAFQWLYNWIYGREWRKVQWGNKTSDLEFVRKYKPLNSELQQLRIMLCGVAGAGKSSFINSMDTVLKGRLAGQAVADTTSGESFTKYYRTYKIQKSGWGTFYPFLFCDTIGFECKNNKGASLEELMLALKGHIKEGYEFNPVTPLSEEDEGYNTLETFDTRVHVLVFVIAADTLDIMSSELLKKMRSFRLAAREMGIPQLAILTKIDEAFPDVKKNLRNVYRIKQLEKMMVHLSKELGFSLSCIFPVKNYHSEININDDVDTLILNAFTHIINYGEDFVNSL